jgi:hypothetical protein
LEQARQNGISLPANEVYRLEVLCGIKVEVYHLVWSHLGVLAIY